MEVLGLDFAHLHKQANVNPGHTLFRNLPYETTPFNYQLITAFN